MGSWGEENFAKDYEWPFLQWTELKLWGSIIEYTDFSFSLTKKKKKKIGILGSELGWEELPPVGSSEP